MSRANDTAFPCGPDIVARDSIGLSVRERFAMAAMQGIIASNRGGSSVVLDVANQAREYADALLDELASEPRS